MAVTTNARKTACFVVFSPLGVIAKRSREHSSHGGGLGEALLLERMMLCIHNVSRNTWDRHPLNFVNVMNSYLSKHNVMLLDRSAPVVVGAGVPCVVGRIVDVQLESGARMGTTPKHLFIRLDTGRELYVRTDD
jgi:hypothetical protein